MYITYLVVNIIFFSLFQSKEESKNDFEKRLKHAGADSQTKAGIRNGPSDKNKYEPDQNSVHDESKDTKDNVDPYELFNLCFCGWSKDQNF